MTATPASAAINSARLNDNLKALGEIGRDEFGMQRVAFSRQDVAGRDYVIGLMRGAGMSVRIDPAGNIIGRVEGTDPGMPAVVLGSHTDTVPSGGAYDGALGVIAAVEVVGSLRDAGRAPRHPVEVMVFTNEEGTSFHRWLLGSRAVAGLWEPEDFAAVADDGVTLADTLPAVGGNISRVEAARRRPEELACYLELHIEQGPTLHRGGFPIGVVTGITGRSVYHVDIVGEANHAGTTPMALRRDAMSAAAQIALAVRRIAGEMEVCRVGTVGSMDVHPNASNVIPGRVQMGVEFRGRTDGVAGRGRGGAAPHLRGSGPRRAGVGYREGPAQHAVSARLREHAAADCGRGGDGGAGARKPTQWGRSRRAGHRRDNAGGDVVRTQRGRHQPRAGRVQHAGRLR